MVGIAAVIVFEASPLKEKAQTDLPSLIVRVAHSRYLLFVIRSIQLMLKVRHCDQLALLRDGDVRFQEILPVSKPDIQKVSWSTVRVGQ